MKKLLSINLLAVWNLPPNVRKIFMRQRAFVLLLLYVHLFCAGCLQSKTLDSVDPISEELPPLTDIMGT